jgi:sn-glycerol 3-phosphate transport system permease protein
MKTEVAMQFEQNAIQFEKMKKQQRKMNLVKGLIFLSPSIKGPYIFITFHHFI